VIAIFSDGTSSDVTGSSTLTAGTTGVTFGVGAFKGRATGVTANATPVVITATYTIGGVNKTATAELTVNSATSKSFEVNPAGVDPLVSIPVTGTQQYTAIETFTDGTKYDRTLDSVWTARTTAGTINNGVTWDSIKGHATGAIASATPVVITATYTLAGVTKTATAKLTVNDATSAKFEVTPEAAEISINGGTQQFAAIETFSDGTSFDRALDPNTTWTAVDVALGVGVATIGLNTGIAKGAALGQSTITATYTFGGVTKTDSAILTVTAPNPGPPVIGSYPNLKTAAPFGIIGYDAITNSAGPSHIYGDVALTQPLAGGTIASVTGPGTNNSGVAPLLASSIVTTSDGVNPGIITAADNGAPANIAALPQLLIDLRAAYDDLFNRAAPVTSLTTPADAAAATGGGTFPAAAPDLSGYVLSPGIYTTAGTYGLSNTLGPLVLDAKGNPDALFIIRSTAVGPSGLTSTTGSVVLRNGAQSKNVFWLVDNATIGAGTFFQGTVVAGHAITLLAHANVEGRMLAGALGLVSGKITLTDTNVITVPR